MTREEAIDLVNFAIDQLIQNDSVLLDLSVTERSLSHKLAHYMALSKIIRPPLTVDCEYNRHFKNPKRLQLPSREASDHEVRATTVFPDILVHERNTDEKNVVVLKVKKSGEYIKYDELKLKAFRKELNYAHAAHVILGFGTNKKLIRNIIWIDD